MLFNNIFSSKNLFLVGFIAYLTFSERKQKHWIPEKREIIINMKYKGALKWFTMLLKKYETRHSIENTIRKRPTIKQLLL